MIRQRVTYKRKEQEQVEEQEEDIDKEIKSLLEEWLLEEIIKEINIIWIKLRLIEEWNKGEISLIAILGEVGDYYSSETRVLLIKHIFIDKVFINSLYKVAYDESILWLDNNSIDSSYQDDDVCYYFSSFLIIFSNISQGMKEQKLLEQEFNGVYYQELIL